MAVDTEDVILDQENNVLDESEEAAGPAVSVAEDTGEGGKLKMIVQLVKRCFGVKDIATMRLSLPASLLEPIPNLEYWHYLDRPDLFAAINDSADPFERMLAVLRFTFSKDLRHIRGKVCKPYNSVLGEHFRAHWDVLPVSYASDPSQPPIQHLYLTPDAAASRLSTRSSPRPSESPRASVRISKGGFGGLMGWSTSAVDRAAAASPVESNESAQFSTLSLATTGGASSRSSAPEQPRVRIAYLTEQVSHHPPVSSFAAACPARHLTLAGVDQIAAKVTSTAAVRIGAGERNKGLFVRIGGGHGAGETYHATHPVAHVNGILRGNFYVTMGEATVVTCSGGPGVGGGQALRAIIEYKEESWLGKAHFAIDGVIHTYDPAGTEHLDWTRPKHVPRARVRAQLDGSWRGAVRWRRADAEAAAWTPLLDLGALDVVPKAVRPLAAQAPNESRRLWDGVTRRLLAKEFGEATRAKHAIEQRQRDEAAERKRRGVEFVPRYFEEDIESGMPVLTAEGRKALEEEMREEGEFALEALLAGE